MMDQGLKLNILSWEHSDGKVIGSFGSAVYVNGMLLQRLSGGASHHPRESTRERERKRKRQRERKAPRKPLQVRDDNPMNRTMSYVCGL